jgi:hypothetical protein
MNLFPEWPPGRNPSNPYVINPHYYANKTQYTYKGSWIQYMHIGNNCVSDFETLFTHPKSSQKKPQ